MKDNKETLSAFEEKAAPKRGALREFAAFYKPHMGMFLLDMFCALIIALVDITFPVVTRKVLYDYIPNQALRTFILMMLAMLGLFILRTLAQWIVTYLGHLTGVHRGGYACGNLCAYAEAGLQLLRQESNGSAHVPRDDGFV